MMKSPWPSFIRTEFLKGQDISLPLSFSLILNITNWLFMQYLGPHPDLLPQNEHLHRTPGGPLCTVQPGPQATRPGTRLHSLPSGSRRYSLHPVSRELLPLLFSLSLCSRERIWYWHLCPLCGEYSWPLKSMSLNCKGPFLHRFFFNSKYNNPGQ